MLRIFHILHPQRAEPCIKFQLFFHIFDDDITVEHLLAVVVQSGTFRQFEKLFPEGIVHQSDDERDIIRSLFKEILCQDLVQVLFVEMLHAMMENITENVVSHFFSEVFVGFESRHLLKIEQERAVDISVDGSRRKENVFKPLPQLFDYFARFSDRKHRNAARSHLRLKGNL